MTIHQRKPSKFPHPGPYEAEITNHLDPTYMGGVEIVIKKGLPPAFVDENTTFPVRYLSPFYGITSIKYEGNDSSNFNDVQKSYGMWMVPPDIGTKVLVIFVEGDPNQGFWIGCIPDKFQNHMVPGIAATLNTAITVDQQRRYGTNLLPTAEFHVGSQNLNSGPNVDKFLKPVHPFADRLLAQGLLLDTVRGVTSSGARRENPSRVFGISTPGPLDTSQGAKRGVIGYKKKSQAPVSRLGGTTFVMDDGDIDGNNELVRLRTRTGHQILLHNSQDLIYIANSKGTAWIELTSNGKIDIYAQDSVSIHTEADFNFRADRDINLEAGRNLNVNVTNNANINIGKDYNLIATDSKILFTGDHDYKTNGNMKLTVSADLHLKAVNSYNEFSGDYNLTGANNNLTSLGNTNVNSQGIYKETADEIHMNGPLADKATGAASASKPDPLTTFNLPNRNKEAGWIDGNLYKSDDITSIMQRVPTFEPWDQHENNQPERFSSDKTDVIAGAAKSDSKSYGFNSAGANEVLPSTNPNQPAEWSKDSDFLNGAKDLAKKIDCSIYDLLACMAFETGRTFDPAKRNFIGATGLIQFIPSTAKLLGTTTKALASLTRTQQLDWVYKYFQNSPLSKVSKPNISDIYMAILWPEAVGKPGNYKLFSAGSKAYVQNPLDSDKKGYVTKDDASVKVKAQLDYVKKQVDIAVKSGLITL